MTENFSTVILVFPQVTEVDKREPRESFLKPRPQAEAEKCSPRFPFFYWGNLDKPQIRRGQICPKDVASTKIETECFFICSGFFVNIQYPILYNAGPLWIYIGKIAWKEIILNTPSTEPQSFQEFHWK